jgi:predicted nucleic acid-binding protein
MASRSKSNLVRQVFVDSAALIALINSKDALHKSAMNVMVDLHRSKAQLLTTELILFEVADALCAPAVRTIAFDFLGGLRLRPTLEIAPTSTELFASGWDLFIRRPDKDWGITDCISSALMEDRGITEAFTSDHHFEQAGFQILL